MRLTKIGIANLNPTVGAINKNTAKIIEHAREMARKECSIGCFPEQVISGYPVEDLVQWDGFVNVQMEKLREIAQATASFEFPTIFIMGLAAKSSGHIYNCAAVICNGRIIGLVPKEKLPTYGVFHESRTFSPLVAGSVDYIDEIPCGDIIFQSPWGRFAVEVCEDIWVADGPMLRRSYNGAELIINISASPWTLGVERIRRRMLQARAADNQVSLVYVNLYGAQDSLVFDGGGFICQNGEIIAEAPRWREGIYYQVIDLAETTRQRSENTTWRNDCKRYLAQNLPLNCIEIPYAAQPNLDGYDYPNPPNKSFFIPQQDDKQRMGIDHCFEDLLRAMVTGLSGYFEKNRIFKRIGIALSGGKDSALSLLVAWHYALERYGNLKKDKAKEAIMDFIHCFSMPTKYNTETTRGISRQLCEELGVTFKEISIEEAFAREVLATREMLGGKDPTPLTIQNIQARIRAARMWNWANSAGALWIQTGNMSEKAVGYTTIGGDLQGGFSVIGNLPKTVVSMMLGYLNKKLKLKSIDRLLETTASAELADNQADEMDLMPFAVLDACFALFAGRKLMPVDLYLTVRSMFSDEELGQMRADYKPGMLKAWVKRFLMLFTGSIYKWVQAPLGVHLMKLDLDRERALQLPTVQSIEWLDIDSIDELPE